MGVRITGADKVSRMLNKLPATAKQRLTAANKANGEELAAVARVLVPVGATGRAKAAIKGRAVADGYEVDFGPLSRILEGGTQERFHKTGKSVGKGPKRPFVNPALKATDKKRRARNRKAIRDAIKDSGNG